ncbi:MAG: DoxX family protein [Gammaproteobacteria bacterium]|nr:DoxX family protein [Gammaproteobacteria bacterium]
MSIVQTLQAPLTNINGLFSSLQSPVLLIFRGWVAYVFFNSGLQKVATWNDEYGVMYLFKEEYNVPLLDPVVAAYLATAGELILPILILFGFATRLSAFALSILNIVAVVSYYATLAKVGQVTPHIFWGAMMLATMVFGPGYFSIDQWLKSKFN